MEGRCVALMNGLDFEHALVHHFMCFISGKSGAIEQWRKHLGCCCKKKLPAV